MPKINIVQPIPVDVGGFGISADQVAECLGVAVLTVKSWRRAGFGPPCVEFPCCGAYRYSAEKFQDWLAEHAANAEMHGLRKKDNND